MKDNRTVRAERRRVWWASLNQTVRTLILIGVAALAVMAFLWVKNKMFGKSEPKITTDYITGKLAVISELNTAEMTYTGVVKYEDGNIPFITKTGFTMIYTATVKAGIDMSQIKVSISDTAVTLTMPETEIRTVYIDPNSIDFYDESFALFNWSNKEDIPTAIAAAENDVRTNADTNSLIEKSREQTEKLIRALLEDAIGDKQLVIKQPKTTQ